MPATTAADETSTHNGTYGSNVGLGSAGALASDANTSATFTGFASSKVTVGPQATLTPGTFTIELWARLTAPPGAGRSPAADCDQSVVNFSANP